MTISDLEPAGWPALFAGCIAVFATRAIERWGSATGGVLATLPTTIVPASLGIAAQTLPHEQFLLAMTAVPFGMALNAGFLGLWQWIPHRLPTNLAALRFPLTLALSLLAWALGAAVLSVFLESLTDWTRTRFVLALVMVGGSGLGGLLLSRRHPAITTPGRPIAAGVLVARGGLAALAVGTAVLLSRVASPTVASMAAVFPAIFLTTMVSLWLSQGEAVPQRAAGPMMLGSASVGTYALLAGLLAPRVGLLLGTLGAWLGAVGLVTLPALLLLRRWGAAGPPPPPGPGAGAPSRP